MQLFAPPRPRQEWVQDPQAECGLRFVSSLSLATGHHHRAATPQDLVLDLICALVISLAHPSFQPDFCFRSHFHHFSRVCIFLCLPRCRDRDRDHSTLGLDICLLRCGFPGETRPIFSNGPSR